jgi:hypothetical protein
VSDTKAEKTNAKTGLAQATLAVPSSRSDVSKAAASQPQAAKAAAQPRQKIGALRMAAVVTVAAMAGALGGALSTANLSQFAFLGEEGTTAQSSPALEASVARIESDIPALKANFEYNSEIGLAKFNETNARLDRLEKAQAEPAAKLAQLTDAVEKLRIASVAPAAVAAATESTGSIEPPAASSSASSADAPAADVGRLPTVQGWKLRGITRGLALIQGRRGLFQVHTGTIIPGVGRVDAIRRQDGRWAVVTAKGLIVGR